MKKICSILLLMVSVQLAAQNYPVTGITISLPTNPPASTVNWSSGTGMVTITAATKAVGGRVDGRVQESKILVTIKKAGSKFCGAYNNNSAPASNFNTINKVWSGNNAVSLLGQDCTLPPGDYELCVQFFGYGPAGVAPLSDEKCKSFTIKGPEQQNYQPPQLVIPSNGSSLKEQDIKRPVTFRWTPVVPKPREAVTYRLRVWQLMQGQNGTQAMKANQPIVTKDVENVTQAVVNNLLTGPCKPPYLCDFIWNVQALDREGHPIGNNNGTSEPFSFSVMGNYGITIQTLKINCPQTNNYSFTANVGNPNNSIAIFDKLEVVVVNGIVITPINITPTVPAIGSTIAANGNINVTGSFTYGTPITTVCIKAYIKEQANPLLNTASSYTCDTLKCACDPCKTFGVTIKDDKLTTTAGTSSQVSLSGVLSGLDPNVIKKITMELMYYNIIQTGDDNCVKCAENKEWGNFIKPGNSIFLGYNGGFLNGVNFGREWTWLSSVQKECNDHGDGGGGGSGGGNGNPNDKLKCATCGTSPAPSDPNKTKLASSIPIIIIIPPLNFNSFSLPIAVPPGSSLKCCGDKIKVCIRFTIWDFCCHACDIVKCYEIERKP